MLALFCLQGQQIEPISVPWQTEQVSYYSVWFCYFSWVEKKICDFRARLAPKQKVWYMRPGWSKGAVIEGIEINHLCVCVRLGDCVLGCTCNSSPQRNLKALVLLSVGFCFSPFSECTTSRARWNSEVSDQIKITISNLQFIPSFMLL